MRTCANATGPGIVAAMRWLLAWVWVVAAAGCGDDQDPARARAVWDRIHADGYRAWQRAPGYEGREPSRAAHGEAVEIFVNDVVAADLASTTPIRQWSEGAVIVKDGYDGGDLVLVAVMEKSGGEWFWAEYDEDGDTLFSGAPDLCTGCHRIGDDFVRAFFFPTEVAP